MSTAALCGRGFFDNKGLCRGAGNWRRLLEQNHITEEGINNSYDAVFDIVTVAQPSGELWKKLYKDNPARRQKTPEEAREREKQIQRDWANHHNLIVFENDDAGWEGKFERMFREVCSILGVDPEKNLSYPIF